MLWKDNKEKLLICLHTGCKVVLWDINAEAVNSVAKEIIAAGGVATPYECNLCDKDMVYRVASKVQEEVGDVTLLFNNAGVVTGKKLLNCSDQDICQTFQVNTLAHFWVCIFLNNNLYDHVKFIW